MACMKKNSYSITKKYNVMGMLLYRENPRLQQKHVRPNKHVQ
jgi:hypothetical protein